VVPDRGRPRGTVSRTARSFGLVPIVGIPACYSLAPVFIERAFLHFGTPAALSIVSVVLLKYLTADIRDWGGRMIALALFVGSFSGSTSCRR
jgi:hypothetical protein